MKKFALLGGFFSAPALLAVFLMTASVTGSGCGTVEDCVFTINESSLPDGIINVAYDFDLGWNASGCVWENDTDNIVWTHSAGTLPPGISFNSNGELSGTPSEAGVYSLTFKVTYDGESNFAEVQKGFSLTIREN